MSRTKPRMDPDVFDVQCEVLLAARRHGATNRSMAAALTEAGEPVCSATVSHFTTSSRPKELTLSQLVAIAKHAGDGDPAADVLGPLLAHLGLVAVVPAAAAITKLQVIKEAGDVVSALASGDAEPDDLERELSELIEAAQSKLVSVRRSRIHARRAS